jgi:thioredoxin reductase (NADPH)
VVVVGGKNSAALAALELWWTGARVTLVHRGETLHQNIKYWIRPNIDNRIRAGEIPAHFRSRLTAIREREVDIETPDGLRTIANDAVFAMTGYQPDLEFLARVGVTLDATTQRPRLTEACESERPGLYLAGVLVAGMHTNEIFIENGRFHGAQIARSIAANLA